MQVQPLLAAPECALRRTTGTMWAVISYIEPDRAYLVRCTCKAVKHFAGDIYRIAIFKGAAFRSNGAAKVQDLCAVPTVAASLCCTSY